jgi:aminopeptidase-like protein
MSGINDSFFKRNINIISNNQPSKTKSISLKTITFDEIVPKNREIDYLSIDIEGGEMNLLKSIDFKINNIKVVSVENNIPKEQNFKNFFEKINFKYFDRIGQDEIFYNNEYFKF